LRSGQPEGEDPYPRFVARDGRPTVRIEGLHRQRFTDGYHWLMTLSWSRFLLWWVAVYLGTNFLFGVLFWLQPGGVAQARPWSFSDAFFFSVQTLGTIGYGAMWPRSLYAHVLVTVEAFSSLALTAVGTGLIFARISRPTARVIFSRCAVVTKRNGQSTLMFRGGNTRLNQILEADVSVSLARNGYSEEGVEYRGLTDLKMVRSRSPLVGLTWTIMHVIDETSPLYRATRESLEAEQAELVIVLSGVDDTFAQRIHARHSYLPHEIVWGRRLADIILRAEDGSRYVDYGRFHDLVDVTPPPAAPAGAEP
jgi:inward rectifier potassium channel